MTKSIIKGEWYVALVEDCEAIITETVFSSRWALVDGYHKLGERIEEEKANCPIEKLIQDLGQTLNKSRSTLWYSVQFYRKYPELDAVPEGKNISWNKIITKYLPAQKEKHSCTSHKKVDAWKCAECGKILLTEPEYYGGETN